MRITVRLNSRLVERLKKRAAKSGTSVSQLVEQSVRLLLQEGSAQPPGRFELVTFGEGGECSPLNIDKTSALLEADDTDRFRSR